MLRVGDDVKFDGCEYRISDIQLGLVRLEGVTGWFDPSMMSAAVTREALKRQIDISETVRHDLEQEINSLSLQLATVTRERDDAMARCGSNQSYGVDSGSACGRNYLSVCGFVVAVEGDIQRDAKLASRFNSPWNKEAINYVVEKAKEHDGNLAKAERERDDLLRKLREWIRNGVFSVVGNSVSIDCQCVPTGLAELLIAIRDGGGM